MKKLPLVLALALFAASVSFAQLVNAGPPQHGQDKKTAKPRNSKPLEKLSKQECDKYRVDEYGNMYYNNEKISGTGDFTRVILVIGSCQPLKGKDEYDKKHTSDSLYWTQRLVEVGQEQFSKERSDLHNRAEKVGWKRAEKEYHEGVKKKRKQNN